MTGAEFATACEKINGGDAIPSTLRLQLGNLGKSLVEQRRPWVILRKTNTSKTVTTSNTWQTAIDLSSITDFNRFYQDSAHPYPITVFDGSNRYEKYRIVPFNRRLDYKDVPNTACYDYANKNLYLNGTVPYAGTLWINYIRMTADFDADDNSIWEFPSYAHILLPFFTVGLHKGGIDWDDINARMAPDNRATAELIYKQLEKWDDELQLLEVESVDPSERGEGFRPNAINIFDYRYKKTEKASLGLCASQILRLVFFPV